MIVEPAQTWWTAREIADAALPDMPANRKSIEALAKRLDWRGHHQFARRRQARGGGWEYHWKLFPMRAQKKLLATACTSPSTRPEQDGRGRDDAWAWFDGLPETAKAKARDRLSALDMVDALVSAGTTKFLAVGEVAQIFGVSDKTIWNWNAAVDGVRADDRLPYLAPRHRGTRRKTVKAECSAEWWDFLKSDYLRLEEPSFTSCYRRAERVAKQHGWTVLPSRTASRRLNREVSKVSQVLARKGMDALKRMYPSQTRDKTALYALEAVNADFHKFDVFVRWPRYEGDNECEIIRPQMVAFQDIYSGRILSWRLDSTPNKTAVALALGDMIGDWGLPEHMLFDNGREFANKFLTGQAQSRFRFKVKDDDIPGVLKSLGVEIHWATPYSGQSKPIERAFLDLCDTVAKDPRFAGAYTGNRPDAKPENYGARAIELDEFLKVVAEGIEEHNARRGRSSATAMGRSFIETFDASYATAPIRKATEEQQRLWLMGAEGLRADSRTGVIRFMKNEYWSPWMHEITGERVVARFDPADFRAGLHIYALDGAYLGHAETKMAAGFFNIDEARAHTKARREWQRAERAALEAHQKLRVTDISGYLDGSAPPPAKKSEARVVRPVFNAQSTPQKPVSSPDIDAAQSAMIASLDEARATRTSPEDDPKRRFRRALDIEAKLRAAEMVRRDDERWLASYQTQPEYAAHKQLYEDFGEGMFAG